MIKTKFDFLIDTFDQDFVSNILRNYGVWEPEISLLINEIMRKEKGIFIDIGSYLGYYAIMASKAGANRVIAIEPVPQHYTKILNSIQANNINNIIVYNNVMSENKNKEFYMSICEYNHGATKITGKETEIKAMSTTLDDIVKEQNIDEISLVKIDVETHELQVLKGFKDGLSRRIVKYFIIELSPESEEMIQSCKEIIRMLHDANYAFHDLGCRMSPSQAPEIADFIEANDFMDKMNLMKQTNLLAIRL